MGKNRWRYLVPLLLMLAVPALAGDAFITLGYGFDESVGLTAGFLGSNFGAALDLNIKQLTGMPEPLKSQPDQKAIYIYSGFDQSTEYISAALQFHYQSIPDVLSCWIAWGIGQETLYIKPDMDRDRDEYNPEYLAESREIQPVFAAGATGFIGPVAVQTGYDITRKTVRVGVGYAFRL